MAKNSRKVRKRILAGRAYSSVLPSYRLSRKIKELSKSGKQLANKNRKRRILEAIKNRVSIEKWLWELEHRGISLE